MPVPTRRAAHPDPTVITAIGTRRRRVLEAAHAVAALYLHRRWLRANAFKANPQRGSICVIARPAKQLKSATAGVIFANHAHGGGKALNGIPASRSTDPDSDIFWGEIAPCEHLLQLYDDDAVFLDSLEGFVAGGISAGDDVIVIATLEHREALRQRLEARGICVATALKHDHYIPLDVHETLAKFMVASWPDDERFLSLIRTLVSRARGAGRKVRAFGEMVVVLWARGDSGATVRLEYLWHQICEEEAFSLLCAYPKSGFTKDATMSLKEICEAHSRVL